MKKKEARNFIIENRRQGKTDQEIYFELRQTSNEKHQIAKLIKDTGTDDAVAKYKIVRFVLIVLLIISVPVFMNFINEDANKPYWGEFLICAIYLSGVLYFSYQLYLGYGAEVLSSVWSIPTVFGIAHKQVEDNFRITIWLSFLFIVALLVFYLSYKMFPKNKFMQELKKNDDGEYVL